MRVESCWLLKSASSVMKDTDFFIAHDERGGNEEEKKEDVKGGFNTRKTNR